MSEATGENQNTSPFDPTEAPGIQLIVQMRIYDVLMGLLSHFEPEKAAALMELHTTGALMGTQPSFSGNFLTDELNSTK